MGDMSPALPEDHGYGSGMGGEAFFTGRGGAVNGLNLQGRAGMGVPKHLTDCCWNHCA